jgi:alpha-galactosidase
MLAAPLIAGNDLRSMTDETKSILMNKEVIAVDQDPQFQPVTEVSHEGDIDILLRPLSDESVVVGIFNRGSAATTASFDRDRLPVRFHGKKLHVRDVWKHEDDSIDGSSVSAEIPKHGVVLLKISAQ